MPIELEERGDIASTRGLGRDLGASESAEGSFTTGDAGGETKLSSLIPSFHAGGEGTWKRSWPLSSARFAALWVSQHSIDLCGFGVKMSNIKFLRFTAIIEKEDLRFACINLFSLTIR